MGNTNPHRYLDTNAHGTPSYSHTNADTHIPMKKNRLRGQHCLHLLMLCVTGQLWGL